MKFLAKCLALATFATAIPSLSAEEVYVYSSRKEHLIKPLFDMYEKKTGVKVKYVTDKAAPLIARLKAEGKRTPADMLITVDAGNLWFATQEGVLKSLDSKVLEENVPAHLRDPKNHWTGLSVRARTIVYNPERVKPTELSTYENLADAQWKGRLCLRTSKKVYNQSLVATMMANKGKEATETVLKGWIKNLAAKPFSNDTKVLKAVAAGQCDVGIVNTYYFGRLMKKEPGLKLALFWPNQKDRGVHVNISGAGITKHAKHPEAAQKLLEWLSSAEAQEQFAGLNMEYPVNPKVEAVKSVKQWGDFKGDVINVNEAGRLQKHAVKLMDTVGYR
ncbi:Fe(3+) ABC transporter substrate-binding protein [Pleionea sp. CnH1-48]|uniref:Fe(3+) ABC transporter substrate-binding protein n=1 Tax=Pleionea sp. CnH1-48 TaxID=2954494 RepID=UPI0020971DB9|nr:Fe(3+) ABC transporter substrate-binding protein [Pleionea sp. CnH1-48]MCO7226222.1 Fe(3+) ABC transporter substrate-binding protein [Pleionea sp. CnH1-48]